MHNSRRYVLVKPSKTEATTKKQRNCKRKRGGGDEQDVRKEQKLEELIYIYISKTSCNHTFLSTAIHVTPNIQLLKASQSKRTLCNIPNKGKQKPKQGQQRKN